MKIDDWYEKAEHGTSGDMVYSILDDWKKDLAANAAISKIYFDIASEVIGGDVVKRMRDILIESCEKLEC